MLITFVKWYDNILVSLEVTKMLIPQTYLKNRKNREKIEKYKKNHCSDLNNSQLLHSNGYHTFEIKSTLWANNLFHYLATFIQFYNCLLLVKYFHRNILTL